jgi:hypothetical protein
LIGLGLLADYQMFLSAFGVEGLGWDFGGRFNLPRNLVLGIS